MADRGYGHSPHGVVDAARAARARRPAGFVFRNAWRSAEDLDRNVPALFRPYVLEFEWDTRVLENFDLPAEGLSVAALEWQLVLPWWPVGKRAFGLRPIDVLENRDLYPDHMLRTMAADLASPIDITLRSSRWFVLDGLHRLVKAKMLGAPTVRVRKVPAELLEHLAVG